MGLHRDGSLFRGLNEIDKEVRRRIWWHIVYLDVQAAVATGLPPLGGSDDSAFDTKMISELKDELIGVGELSSVLTQDEILAEEESIRGSDQNIEQQLSAMKTNTAMIAAVGRFETTLVLRRLVVNLFGLQPPDKQKITEMGAMISELRNKLSKRINRIPTRGVPELGVIHPIHADQAEKTEAEQAETFNSWARTALSLLGDKAFGVLYQPFLKSTKSKLWQFARQWYETCPALTMSCTDVLNSALRSCHSFLQKYMLLSTSPSFQPYNWFIPGTYQPLHATMIILLDLYERPFSGEAKTNRHHLDQVFSLIETDKQSNEMRDEHEGERRMGRRTAEGGKEAWEMMDRLRRKAYARAEFGSVKLPSSTEEGDTPGSEQQKSREYAPNRQNTNLVSLPSPPDSMKDIVSPIPLAQINSPIDPAILMPYPLDGNIGEFSNRHNTLPINGPASHIADYSDIGTLGSVVPGFMPTPFHNSSRNEVGRLDQQGNLPELKNYREKSRASSTSENEESYFPLASVGGVSVDSSGAPMIIAPGMNMNMDTGQVHAHPEDGGSFGTSNVLDNSMLMDMSTNDFDWTEWDAVFGTYVATMQTDDMFEMSSLFGQQGHE